MSQFIYYVKRASIVNYIMGATTLLLRALNDKYIIGFNREEKAGTIILMKKSINCVNSELFNTVI